MAWDWHGPYSGIVLIDPTTGEPYAAGDAVGSLSSEQLPETLGPKESGSSLSITWSTDEPVFSAAATAIRVVMIDAAGVEVPTDQPTEVDPASTTKEDVAASQTAQVIGTTGAIGDFLSHVTVSPQTTSPGVVTILDDATVQGGFSFVGGASSVSNLVPFTIIVGSRSANGAWKITTGANVKATAVGAFT